MPDYDGLVPRDVLVKFAQEMQKRIQRDRDALETAMERIGPDDPRYMEFQRVDWMRMGEQTSLRNVCEWAKTVTVDPLRVSRVMFQVVTPQYFSDIRHAHRGAWVAGISLLHRIDTEHTYGIGEGFSI